MKCIVVRCGCSLVVKTIDIDDHKKDFTLVEYAGECEECANRGGDYAESPNWKGIRREERGKK